MNKTLIVALVGFVGNYPPLRAQATQGFLQNLSLHSPPTPIIDRAATWLTPDAVESKIELVLRRAGIPLVAGDAGTQGFVIADVGVIRTQRQAGYVTGYAFHADIKVTEMVRDARGQEIVATVWQDGRIGTSDDAGVREFVLGAFEEVAEHLVQTAASQGHARK